MAGKVRLVRDRRGAGLRTTLGFMVVVQVPNEDWALVFPAGTHLGHAVEECDADFLPVEPAGDAIMVWRLVKAPGHFQCLRVIPGAAGRDF